MRKLIGPYLFIFATSNPANVYQSFLKNISLLISCSYYYLCDLQYQFKNKLISRSLLKTKNPNQKKDKIFVKFIPNFTSTSAYKEALRKNCKTEYCWNNLQVTDQEQADYYVIINNPFNGSFSYYEEDSSIVLQMEPAITRKTWGPWYLPNQKKFMSVFDMDSGYMPGDWHLNQNYSELLAGLGKIQKSKEISTITSNLYNLDGHKRRVDALKILDKKISIDFYGKECDPPFGNKNFFSELTNYKGPLPLYTKDSGLLPYRYHIASENSCEPNYFSEKIIDPILAETLCFYDGCPNLSEFIDPEAYIEINLDNPNEAAAIIREAIINNEWEKRIEHIRSAKLKFLNELQIMPTVEKIILEHRS